MAHTTNGRQNLALVDDLSEVHDPWLRRGISKKMAEKLELTMSHLFSQTLTMTSFNR